MGAACVRRGPGAPPCRRREALSCATLPPAETSVTPPMPRSLQAPVRNGVVLLVSLLAIGACTANGPLAPSSSPVARHSPSPSPSPLPSPEESPSPSPTPTIEPTPVAVPSWAALHATSPDRGFLAYVASDGSGDRLHVLSGGGDRVIATMGAVPARGVNPNEDDAYLAFSPDGAYIALVQTFASSGDQLQVRRIIDGTVAFSLSRGTMATWGSTGSRLYFRQPTSTLVQVWDSAAGVSQAFGQQLSWIRPRAGVGTDTTLVFTVRDSSGTPHTWLYSHDGRSGGVLPNARSSGAWLNATTFFYVEEAACGANCGIGPSWQPDGKTFTFDVAAQAETASKIAQVYGLWPRAGQQ